MVSLWNINTLSLDWSKHMKNKNEIEFICPKCKTKELIPTYIVEMLDKSDQVGVDTSVPPRFDCQKCNGKMVPIYYIGVKGQVYEYKEK